MSDPLALLLTRYIASFTQLNDLNRPQCNCALVELKRRKAPKCVSSQPDPLVCIILLAFFREYENSEKIQHNCVKRA